jgi:hypothetical protein
MIERWNIWSDSLQQAGVITTYAPGVAAVEFWDGTEYSVGETHLLSEVRGELDPRVHLLKKIFEGTIVSANGKTINS